MTIAIAPQTWEGKNELAIAEAQRTARRWFILKVANGAIAEAIDKLPALGAIAFVPTEQRTRRSGRGKRSSITVSQPLIAGYLMAGFEHAPNWPVVLQQKYVRDVLRRDGLPGFIATSDLRALIGIHQTYIPALPGTKSLKVGDAIRVMQGAFTGHEAKLFGIKGAECEFEVNLFGRNVKWRQPITGVEAA